jgi:hypothetical protein
MCVSTSASSVAAPGVGPFVGSGVDVFLGGACGASTWRLTTAIPFLEASGLTYYNPQVAEWKPQVMCLEMLMKAWARWLLFVVDGSTRGAASMVEAASLIAQGRKIILVLSPLSAGLSVDGGPAVGALEAKDLNRGREYLREEAAAHGVYVCDSVDDGCRALLRAVEEERAATAAAAALAAVDAAVATHAAAGASVDDGMDEEDAWSGHGDGSHNHDDGDGSGGDGDLSEERHDHFDFETEVRMLHSDSESDTCSDAGADAGAGPDVAAGGKGKSGASAGAAAAPLHGQKIPAAATAVSAGSNATR